MTKRHVFRAALLAAPLLLLAFTPLLVGQSPDEAANFAELRQVAAGNAPDSKPSGKDEPKRFPEAKDVTKDMKASEGLFTLYRFDPADKQRDPERLIAQIPRGLLGEDLLFALSISRGPMAGWMWRDELVRWEVAGNQLKLIVPDTRYNPAQKSPVGDVVGRTYTDSYLAAVPIIGATPQGDLLIDLGTLLKSDLADVGSMGGRVRPELSTWTKVKSFPDNILIDADLALAGGLGGKSVGVSYAFRRLPKLGSYAPRQADPRIGYFLTAQMDWSKKHSERELFDRFIHRWKLEKQDAALELSPPKEPIVFIIEKTVPIQWRRWVRDGILEWNRAFEQIGFSNAIIVQQQTDDNEYADYDPEDARYNFLRWGVTGRAFAMGPSRADPRTGQILDADILFDDSFVRAWMYNFDVFGPTSLAQFKGPAFLNWLESHPDLVPGVLKEALVQERQDPELQLYRQLEDKLEEHGRCACSYASGMQQQLALVQGALLATGSRKLPERFFGEAIQEIVTHEVGHTLGLRHNFRASAWLSLEEILNRRDKGDEPTTASVMDYVPLLFFPGDTVEKVRHFISPTVGPYDCWAIEYGYGVPQGKPEEEYLKEIAARSTQPELQYATDEDTMWIISPDPLVNRYDLSDSPIEFARARIELTEQLMGNIGEWAVQEGEPMHYLTRAYDTLWLERFRNLDYVARLVSGQYFYRDHKGTPDGRPPFVLVEPEKQREALKYLGETVFSDAYWLLDAELLNSLAPSRWSHWGQRSPTRLDHPTHTRIRGMQVSILLDLCVPQVLERIYDAELKSAADDKFTAAELIRSVRDLVWRQLDGGAEAAYTDAQPFISSVARNLQQDHLMILLNMAEAQPGDAMPADLYSMIRLALRELSEKMEKTLVDRKLDFASRAHLLESKSRIDRVLNAQFQAR